MTGFGHAFSMYPKFFFRLNASSKAVHSNPKYSDAVR